MLQLGPVCPVSRNKHRERVIYHGKVQNLKETFLGVCCTNRNAEAVFVNVVGNVTRLIFRKVAQKVSVILS